MFQHRDGGQLKSNCNHCGAKNVWLQKKNNSGHPVNRWWLALLTLKLQEIPWGGGYSLIIYGLYMVYAALKGINGFLALFFINSVSTILVILISYRIWFLYFSHELGMFFRWSYFFISMIETINKSPSQCLYYRSELGK